MPSKSGAQHRLMEAAAHKPGGAEGVPQAVGKEFTAADAKKAPLTRSKAKAFRPIGERLYGSRAPGTK